MSWFNKSSQAVDQLVSNRQQQQKDTIFADEIVSKMPEVKEVGEESWLSGFLGLKSRAEEAGMQVKGTRRR